MELERRIDNPGISDGNTPIVTAAHLTWKESGSYSIGIKIRDPKDPCREGLGYIGTAKDRMDLVGIIEGFYGKLALSDDEGVKLIMSVFSHQIKPFFSEIVSTLIDEDRAERGY